jgi:hypothetical protein
VRLRSFAAALPGVRRAHSDDEVRRWVADVLLAVHDVWAADVDGTVVGVLALAEQRQPDGLQLWTFWANGPARRFYLRHGFTEVERTDGSGNEEHEPDVRYTWRP